MIFIATAVTYKESTEANEAQAAGILIKDLPNGMPKQDIVVENIRDFYTIEPDFYTTIPEIVMNYHDISNFPGKYIYYNGTPSGS